MGDCPKGDQMHRRGFVATALGLGVLLATAHAGAADGPQLGVGPIRRVGAEGSKYFEPWIAANPRDAANLVIVAARDFGAVKTPHGFHREPAAWSSRDGGSSWSPAELAGMDDLGRDEVHFADACATYAPDGTAFCVFLGSPRAKQWELRIYRSDDGGRRWQGPTKVPGFPDYPRLAADLHDGQPRLFVFANGPGDEPVFGKAKRPGFGCIVLRSDDGARTVSAVNLLAPTTLWHTPIETPSFLPDGRLLIGFADFTSVPEEKKPQAHITRGRVYTAISQDGGATFSMPAPVRDVPMEDGYTESHVVIAVDRSDGPHRGRTYALTCSGTQNPPGLQLQTSQNAIDWTAPKPVPGLGGGPTPYAAIAVSPQGVIGVSWIEGAAGDLVRGWDKAWTTREHPWTLHFTASTDGGTTFAAPVTVLPTPSRTDTKSPDRPFRTDYHSLAAAADGAFHPVWIDTREGKAALQTVRIEVLP